MLPDDRCIDFPGWSLRTNNEQAYCTNKGGDYSTSQCIVPSGTKLIGCCLIQYAITTHEMDAVYNYYSPWNATNAKTSCEDMMPIGVWTAD